MFIKLPSSNVQAMLQQGKQSHQEVFSPKKQTLNLTYFSLLFYEDQKNLEEEISRLRKDLKPKVSKLHELEGL